MWARRPWDILASQGIMDLRLLSVIGVVVALSAGAVAMTSCSVYDASLVSSGGKTPPARPPMTTEGPDGEELLFALRNVFLDQEEAWATVGYDLDGRNTTSENGDQECLDAEQGFELDGEDGIDNVFGGAFFPSVQKVLPTIQDDARAAQDAGRGTLLLHVRGWNHEPNDPLITVDIVQAAAGTSEDPSLVEFDGFELVYIADGEPAPPPAWDGNDHWWAREDSYLNGETETPFIQDDDAYVANGTAVVQLPTNRPILFFVGDKGVIVRLSDAVATAELVDSGESLSNIVVAGRWAVDDLHAIAPNIGLCIPSLVALLNQEASLRADVRADGEPSNSPCDAVSMGVSFELGVKGTFVDLGPSRPIPNPCETTDPPDGGV